MDSYDSSLEFISDHIMANTWRLIFERKARSLTSHTTPPAIPDFSVLEQLLPEYRLIGLALAGDKNQHRLH